MPATMHAEIVRTPRLADVISNRRWLRRSEPFDHIVAHDVFTAAFSAQLEAEFRAILDAKLFSKNMPNSDAYAWNFPPDVGGGLAVFYSREFHDMLATMMGVEATGDVNAALHHHHVGSLDGSVHRDLGVGWFSSQPRPDAINPMDLSRCSYTHGTVPRPGIEVREVVRAITMIYYLANPSWTPADGGETGLYRAADCAVTQPAASVPPTNNSILVFENTPHSHHSFIANRRRARNSAILWLHRTRASVQAQWSEVRVSTWR